jgi:hypothetical protein
MKAFKTILLLIGVTLLLVDVSYHIWAWHHYAEGRAFLERFKMGYTHTNDMTCLEIYDAKTGQPIWAKVQFGNDSNSVMESYYFQGKDAFDVTLSSNRPPKFGVYFRGSGKSETWWFDRLGNGSFTERVYYDTNGVFSKHEVWYDNKWQLVDRRDRTNGLVIDGMWHAFARIGTNEAWTLAEVSTNHF